MTPRSKLTELELFCYIKILMDCWNGSSESIAEDFLPRFSRKKSQALRLWRRSVRGRAQRPAVCLCLQGRGEERGDYGAGWVHVRGGD
ncbi:hypothetical protein CEXT_317111 [Caerostris extrusa]|uniref:Uncharacterized protein n=1 Tax=Caerostris extrusa TaxID=172846 RepID=A0AAV4TCW6_CAEEX|nr:hypothetical protein CEXT_317111 [Caerostris extrusa]